jgi:stage V sporulation protein R
MDCDDPKVRREWDTGAGLGREKIFEVRRTHNDVTFLDTFLTEDFCREQGFFTTTWDSRAKEWVIDSREFKQVKTQLLDMIATQGSPQIYVADANHGNRGELRLLHKHEGSDLQLDWAEATLANLVVIWGRPVCLDTVIEDQSIRISHDGEEFKKGRVKRDE